jgi:hypothetical protein
MESAPMTAQGANQMFAAGHFLKTMQTTCYEKCVVDFQTKDISAMEKECANACLRKHMAVW